MTKRQQLYQTNKAAKVGTMITCPVCGDEFKKRQYSQAFCCGQCKDTYWNAKGDRHNPFYYEDYDAKHPERQMRRKLYGGMQVISIGGELTPRQMDEIQENFFERKRELEIYE